MSATGKSTLIGELAARGYKAVDLDADAWSEWIEVEFSGDPASPESPVEPGRDWVWREDRVQDLLSTEDADMLFVSGCAENMVKFYAQFDHIVLLTAPTAAIVERLAVRTTNAYGKRPEEVARVLGLVRTVEPLLRRVAGLEVDTSVPLDQVVAKVLQHVEEGARSPTVREARAVATARPVLDSRPSGLDVHFRRRDGRRPRLDHPPGRLGLDDLDVLQHRQLIDDAGDADRVTHHVHRARLTASVSTDPWRITRPPGWTSIRIVEPRNCLSHSIRRATRWSTSRSWTASCPRATSVSTR